MVKYTFTLLIFLMASLTLPAKSESADWRNSLLHIVEQQYDIDDPIALKIGELAELGFQEHKSSALLQDRLKAAGFSVTSGVAGMPTAFVATYGSGKPVIGILAEFDAIPGFSQAPQPVRSALKGQNTGHACGHNLLGAGAVLAAVSAKEWLNSNNHKGTIKVFGAPAEEGGSGKTFLVRAGLFNDVDATLNWHPDSINAAVTKSNLAWVNGKFRFYGHSTHAAFAPEKGRSALDGVEAMNMMVNMMREHIGEKSRIHYAIIDTNPAPNVVPDYAEVAYYVRDPDINEARTLWERVNDAAKGAALGTSTRVEIEEVAANYSYLPNNTLSEISHRHLQYVGGVTYTREEKNFATTLSGSFSKQKANLSGPGDIQPFTPYRGEIWPSSSDVGDVSWVTPTNWLRTATYVPGTSPHSWQVVAASNMSIGLKGMHVAAKTLALTMVDLIRSPELLTAVREEFENRRGKDFKYTPAVKREAPPLNYRKYKNR